MFNFEKVRVTTLWEGDQSFCDTNTHDTMHVPHISRRLFSAAVAILVRNYHLF